MSGKRLSTEEKESILKDIRRKAESFQSIAKEHSVSISTVSRIAAEHGLSSPRKRSSAAEIPEHSYDRAQRIAALDRMLNSIDKMVANGGLSTRQLKDLASAAQSVYSTRRAEDIEPEVGRQEEEQRWVPLEGMGEMRVDPNTDIGRELLGLQKGLKQEGGHPGEEYGS